MVKHGKGGGDILSFVAFFLLNGAVKVAVVMVVTPGGRRDISGGVGGGGGISCISLFDDQLRVLLLWRHSLHVSIA